MTPLTTTSPRQRVWRALLSALAGGGLTAVGLGWPLAGKALATDISVTAKPHDSAVPVTVTETGSGSSGSGSSGSGSSAPGTSTGESAPPANGGGQPTQTTTTTTPLVVTPSTAPAPSKAAPAPSQSPSTSGSEAPAIVLQRKQKTTAPKKAGPNVSATHAQPNSAASTKGATALPANSVALPPQVVAAQAGILAAELAGSAASSQALAYYRIPLFLLPIYQAAAAQYGVPWQILAAINEIETDYGNDLSVSSAGAGGWMQFMPATWLQYGVDALNAGYADPYNPVDAIFAAARYLRAAGVSTDLRAAILAYNHSAEYVSSVLLRAKLISRYPSAVIATLTGLTDGRLPVRNNKVSWDAIARLVSPSSATAQASPAAPPPSGSTSPSATGAPQVAPAPGTAAATASKASAAQPLQLLDLVTSPNATVVAVQDGRIVKVGSSRQLGKYVILRDVYGDLFTYAGLGSVAPTYVAPKSPRIAGLSGGGALAAADSREPAPKHSASAGRQLPMTLSVKAPRSRPSGAGGANSAHGSTASVEPSVPPLGKVRLFAHPGNPDAVAAAAASPSARAARHSVAGAHAPTLRSGSVVAKGTVLGHVRTPTGAHAGHIRFAIRPAGDLQSIDPRPILQNWSQLSAALHPQGAPANTDLLGATASGVFLLSQGQLQREVLSDPGIGLAACGRHAVAIGMVDKRVLAVLAFLSRSGLKPAAGVSCVPGHHTRSVDVFAIDAIAVAAHQGPGTITDTVIRTLLTLKGEFVPYQIVSLMRYPGAANTLARPAQSDHIHIAYRPPTPPAQPSSVLAAAARSKAGHIPGAPVLAVDGLSSHQWGQLLKVIGTLPTPNVAVKPSASAIPDPRRP